MRRFSLLAVVVAASLLGALAIAATSASATVLCKKAPSNHYCGYENIYPNGTKLQAKLKPSTAVSIQTEGEVLGSCSSSSFDATVNGVGGLGESASAEVTAFSFSECKRSISVMKNDPMYNGYLDFRWTSETHTGGVFHLANLQINLAAWGAPNQLCYYQLTGLHPIVSGETPQIDYKGSTMLKLSGSSWLCPQEVTFDATYNLTTPTPLYIEKY